MGRLHQRDTFVTGSDTVKEAEEMQNPRVRRFPQGAHMGSGALFELCNPLLLHPSRMLAYMAEEQIPKRSTSTGEVRVKRCSSFHKSYIFSVTVTVCSIGLVFFWFKYCQKLNEFPSTLYKKAVRVKLEEYCFLLLLFLFFGPYLPLAHSCVLYMFYITISFCD